MNRNYVGLLFAGAVLFAVGVFWGQTASYNSQPKSSPSYQDLGKLVDIQSISTSWNEKVKSRVITDKGVFLVYGMTSGLKGDPVRVSDKGYLYVGNSYGVRAAGYKRNPQ